MVWEAGKQAHIYYEYNVRDKKKTCLDNKYEFLIGITIGITIVCLAGRETIPNIVPSLTIPKTGVKNRENTFNVHVTLFIYR